MKAKSNNVVAWDLSFWFALLSPILGVLFGLFGIFLFQN
jgi:hypothetical protein